MMQCRSDNGGHYDPRYLNAGIIGLPGPITQGDITQSGGLRFNLWFPPSNMDYYNVGYQKEIYRQMMLKHEATFKYQVYELHRVYGRQKELMEEIRKREMLNQNLKAYPFSGIRSDYFLPSGGNHTTQTKPYAPSAHLFQEPYFPQSHPGHYPAKDVTIREHELSASHINTPRKRKLDLELPAYEYIDSDDENAFQEPQMPKPEQPFDSKIESFSSGNAKVLFDLNSPAQADESGAGQDPPASFTVSDRRNLPKVVDLNMLPADFSSNEECSGHTHICNEKSMINLNSCLDEERILLLPPPPDQSDTNDPARQSGLEAPVSPENKECSPPRGDSEDNQLEAGIQEEEEQEDRVAADTLFVLASSGNQRCSTTTVTEQNETFNESLVWFAGIATSTRSGGGRGSRNRSSKALERTVCLAVWGKTKKRKIARVARSVVYSHL
ncbi:unnamed protein product [Cuscuta campestris]|uniref:Uncharacterized protein n=1 Tax=Cuscuta campestris TaxID=132261 RepID=A0A484MEN3_9ASTE|nr:unnamed protein product [Cuscuta campestris]